MLTALAWEDVPAKTLTKVWFKLLGSRCLSPADSTLRSEKSQVPTSEQLLHQVDATLPNDGVSEWLHSDPDDPGYQLLFDADIIQQVTLEQVDKEDSDEDDSHKWAGL